MQDYKFPTRFTDHIIQSMSFVASVDVLKVSNVTYYFNPRSAVIYPIIVDTEIPSKNWFEKFNHQQIISNVSSPRSSYHLHPYQILNCSSRFIHVQVVLYPCAQEILLILYLCNKDAKVF